MCASFQKTVTDVLIENTKKAIQHVNNNGNIIKLALAGGVSANSYIRNEFLNLEKKQNIKVYMPDLKLCTDNAAMIASSGYYNYINGNLADYTLNAVPNLKL